MTIYGTAERNVGDDHHLTVELAIVIEVLTPDFTAKNASKLS